MKNISELNNKWWYRLIKVFFYLIIIFCILCSVSVIFDINKPKEVTDYKIACRGDYTNKKSFFAEKDAGIYIYDYDKNTVYTSLSDEDRKKIRNGCDITEAEANTNNQKAIEYIKEQEGLGIDHGTIQKYIDNNLRPYTVSEVTRNEGSYLAIIEYSLPVILIALAIAEIIRRIFYYIILGKIKPEK